MKTGPAIITPRTAPPPEVVLRPLGLALIALAAAGLWLVLLGPPQGGDLLGLIHLALVAGLLSAATAAATQLSAATTGQGERRPGLVGVLLLAVPVGGFLLAAGFTTALPVLLALGGAVVLTGVAGTFAAALGKVWRSGSLLPLHLGLLLGLGSFLGAVSVGLAMAILLAMGSAIPLAVLPWHLALALAMGFGALLAGVSWQILPMFGRARRLDGPLAYAAPLAFVLAAIMAAFGWRWFGDEAAWPLVFATGLHAALSTWAVLASPSRKPPPFTGLAHLAAALLLLAASLALVRGLWLDALLAAFGGYGIAVLGYLERIVPFIVFEGHLRRRSPGAAIPKLEDILPRGGRLVWLALYVGSLAAALSGLGLALRFFGLALLILALRPLLALRRLPRARLPS